jgi:hypothetical protein
LQLNRQQPLKPQRAKNFSGQTSCVIYNSILATISFIIVA